MKDGSVGWIRFIMVTCFLGGAGRTTRGMYEYIHRSPESDECAMRVIFICLLNVFRDRGSTTTS